MINKTDHSNKSEMFYEIDILKNFPKLTRKHLDWSCRPSVYNLIYKNTQAQVFSCKFWATVWALTMITSKTICLLWLVFVIFLRYVLITLFEKAPKVHLLLKVQNLGNLFFHWNNYLFVAFYNHWKLLCIYHAMTKSFHSSIRIMKKLFSE